ncbi:hypothetical protein OF83DRAFT_1088023 [Amylostereum chailletii]|nr:hypothetical protein OF83DRAFT_1088023 [Amylostereum chailletii]
MSIDSYYDRNKDSHRKYQCKYNKINHIGRRRKSKEEVRQEKVTQRLHADGLLNPYHCSMIQAAKKTDVLRTPEMAADENSDTVLSGLCHVVAGLDQEMELAGQEEKAIASTAMDCAMVWQGRRVNTVVFRPDVRPKMLLKLGPRRVTTIVQVRGPGTIEGRERETAKAHRSKTTSRIDFEAQVLLDSTPPVPEIPFLLPSLKRHPNFRSPPGPSASLVCFRGSFIVPTVKNNKRKKPGAGTSLFHHVDLAEWTKHQEICHTEAQASLLSTITSSSPVPPSADPISLDGALPTRTMQFLHRHVTLKVQEHGRASYTVSHKVRNIVLEPDTSPSVSSRNAATPTSALLQVSPEYDESAWIDKPSEETMDTSSDTHTKKLRKGAKRRHPLEDFILCRDTVLDETICWEGLGNVELDTDSKLPCCASCSDESSVQSALFLHTRICHCIICSDGMVVTLLVLRFIRKTPST